MAFARRMLNAADAEDVVQDALLAAFLKLDNLREPQRFRSWFLVAASLFFYGSWNAGLAFIVLGSSTFDCSHPGLPGSDFM